jgi:hypothetical protein
VLRPPLGLEDHVPTGKHLSGCCPPATSGHDRIWVTCLLGNPLIPCLARWVSCTRVAAPSSSCPWSSFPVPLSFGNNSKGTARTVSVRKNPVLVFGRGAVPAGCGHGLLTPWCMTGPSPG